MKQNRTKFIQFFVLGLLLFALVLPTQVLADDETPENPYYQVNSVILEDGTELDEIIIAGPPEPPLGSIRPVISLADPHQNGNIHIITSVPAFNWSFGCSATSAAMIAGYYDRNGYPNMYAGPTHSGVMPMDNSYWPDWYGDNAGAQRHQCPLSATHNSLDGRVTRGHVDDYWVEYDSSAPDPFDGNWTEHTYGDCTGDYMYTNQTSNYTISDGATRFWSYGSNAPLHCATLEGSADPAHHIDGTVGFKNFYQSRGYTVTDCYYQKTDNQYTGGFSFSQYKAEIDAGNPVMIHVEGHTMVGFGYDDSVSPETIYLRDTWDYSSHTMPWGGTYGTFPPMLLVGVSIVHLAPNGYNSAQTGNWNVGSTWIGGSAPGASDTATIQSGHTVTIDSDTTITHLAIEYDATLIIPNGVTLSVEGTFSNNGTIQQTKSVPMGSTTEFLHITNFLGTADMYHGLDVTPATTSMGNTTVSISGNHTGGCTTVSADPLLYRCYEITPASQESATLKFWYDEDERNEQNASALVLWHNDGGSSWTQVGTYTRSEVTTDCQTGGGQECWLEAAGISNYSVFDIGSGSTPTVITVRGFDTHIGPEFSIVLLIGLLFTIAGVGALLYQRRKI